MQISYRGLPAESLKDQKNARQMAYPAVAVVQANDELLKNPARLLFCKAAHRPVSQGVLQKMAMSAMASKRFG